MLLMIMAIRRALSFAYKMPMRAIPLELSHAIIEKAEVRLLQDAMFARDAAIYTADFSMSAFMLSRWRYRYGAGARLLLAMIIDKIYDALRLCAGYRHRRKASPTRFF